MFETVGQKLCRHLGLNIDLAENVVIQRAIGISSGVPLFRVILDSRYPNRTILYSVLKREDSIALKSGRYNSTTDSFKKFRWTPPQNLLTTDIHINDNATIILVDLAVDLYKGSKIYEAKESNGKLRLREFTIGDFKSGMLDDHRKEFERERLRVRGQETKVTKLIKAEIVGNKDVLFRFLTEPTFEFRVPVVDPNTLSNNFKTDNTYDVEIKLLNFIPYLEEKELDFKLLSLNRFKEILEVVDVQMWCSCPMLSWGPYNWELSKIGASTHPTNIPAKTWNKIYKKNDWGTIGYGCKHLGAIMKNIKIFESVMLGKLREIRY